jgi:hypothetical protein
MQSDPWWSFAMAVNVYMVFFMGYPTVNFRRHIWIYCVLCFGIPAIPAFICLLYAPNGKKIYGNATVSIYGLPGMWTPGADPVPSVAVVLDR